MFTENRKRKDSWDEQEREIATILDNFIQQANTQNKSSNPQKLIKEILRHTKNNPELTKQLSQRVLENDISADKEEKVIEKLWNSIQKQSYNNSVTEEIENKVESELVTNNSESHQLAQKILASEFEEAQLNNLIEEILSWTGNQSELIKVVCKLLIEQKDSLKQGEQSIEELIQRNIIENWQQGRAVQHLMEMRSQLLNKDADAVSRLETYKQILQDRVSANEKPETLALLQAELIINNDGCLKVTNRIYREVFSLSWVKQELDNMAQRQNPPAPLTKILSFFVFILVIIGSIFVASSNKEKTPDTGSNTDAPEICRKQDSNDLLKDNIDNDTNNREHEIEKLINNLNKITNDIDKLKDLKKQNPEQFSSFSECNTQFTELNKLKDENELKLVDEALKLAVNSKIANNKFGFDALQLLCEIPDHPDAKYWVDNWYNTSWKSQIKKAFEGGEYTDKCRKILYEELLEISE